jgi:hypothetical protein
MAMKTPPKNLLHLPLAVLDRLHLFLDVSSLESLGSTCSFLHQLIFAKHIPTLDFPFSPGFVSELGLSSTIEKKPLLRLRSHKADDSNIPDDEDVFVEYLVSSQLALLSLSSLRELYLVPPKTDLQDITRGSFTRIAGFVNFDRILLRQVSALGCLGRVTRLDILIDRHCFLDEFMDQLPSLLHLGLTVHTLKSLRSVF